MISEYNSIRARLRNTTALDDVNLTFFNINETTLVKWYKNDVRRDEIRMLMQGLPPSQPQLCADDDLPPAKQLPSSPAPPPVKPHSFPEAEDTSGQAEVRRKTKSSSRPSPISSQHLPPAPPGLSAHQFPPPSQPEVSIPHTKHEISASAPGPSGTAPSSCTTAWRHKKERDGGKQVKTRKIYTCKVCSQPMTTEGHTQFRGQRYCPHAPGQIPQDEWLKKKKEEAARKKQGPGPQ